MILPISKSFQSLKTRLECINVASFELPMGSNQNPSAFFGQDYNMSGSEVSNSTPKNGKVNGALAIGELKIEECLKCFDEKAKQIQDYFKQREEELLR